MGMPASERESAIAAADSTCPRCGAAREPNENYCLECGLRLPQLNGRVPALRRSWIRRFGWYPGDWIWISLLTLLVAAAGAAVSIALTVHRDHERAVITATTNGAVAPPVPVTPSTVGTSTLPTAPEPTTKTSTTPAKKPPGNGRVSWPAHTNGWTIVLVSYPKVNGRPAALQTAAKAVRSLRQVGVLDSSVYASLQPGYFVVFTGIYGSRSDADAGVSTARQAGFGGAYSRQIAR
jgi:hypothetical protein